MGRPEVSVITWDACFREFFHTVRFFANQTLERDRYEFIWADYYENVATHLRNEIERVKNAKIFSFRGKAQWHLGRCLNAAIAETYGDILVIPDGDIVVDPVFLEEVVRCHKKVSNLVMYFRRFDEPREKHSSDISLNHLKQVCRLNNPTNYGGCLTLRRETFQKIKGYEEHEIFNEAGANGLELYVRLKNAGCPILWHPDVHVYHPWHSGTLPDGKDYLRKAEKQFWLIHQRDLEQVSEASVVQAEEVISRFVPSESFVRRVNRHLRRLLKK